MVSKGLVQKYSFCYKIDVIIVYQLLQVIGQTQGRIVSTDFAWNESAPPVAWNETSVEKMSQRWCSSVKDLLADRGV